MEEKMTASDLAYALIDRRIKGEIRDITYVKDVMEDVKCKVTVEIVDHRPCYCGAELKEVWQQK